MNKQLWTFVVLFVLMGSATAGTTSYLILNSGGGPGGKFLPSFTDYDELSSYIASNSDSSEYYNTTELLLGVGQDFAAKGEGSKYQHSETNVQVEGVDEADIVKIDGEFIYIASSNTVTILRAYPPSEMEIVSSIDIESMVSDELDLDGVHIDGIYVSSERLMVISSSWNYPVFIMLDDDVRDLSWMPSEPYTLVSIFDLEDIENPSLVSTVGISGYLLTSRMKSDYVYLVSQTYIWHFEDEFTMPKLYTGHEFKRLQPSEVYYDPESLDACSYLNILAVNVNSIEMSYMSIIAEYTSTIYMSHNALYLTFQKWTGNSNMLEMIDSTDWGNSAITTIYRINIDELSMQVTACGNVIGWLLNQFSMDEKTPYFRIATTTSWSEPKNNVYILNEELEIIGSLEGLAPTERIYSARFVDDILYLVTFRQIDPFFVIDLSDPEIPTVLGELKIPGFSSYLHPVDSTHVLGIGRENSSVKVSLFDVSDPMHPEEISKYSTGGYSYSYALGNHKAVLFDRELELLVIPITATHNASLGYCSAAYVFTVSEQAGISLRGIITHGEYTYVERAHYIDNYLYTISESVVKANSLDDLSEAGSLTYQ